MVDVYDATHYSFMFCATMMVRKMCGIRQLDNWWC